MKRLITSALIATLALGAFAQAQSYAKSQAEAKRLCEIFKKKTEDYRKHMRDDELAKKTLQSYIDRENKFCAKVKPHA